MLDENLPTFLLKPHQLEPKQKETFHFSQHGSDFQPVYTLKRLDPTQHASRNRYAAALYDAFNADVLYGEVLLVPEWTQPSLSAEQIRLNGGVPPPPEPILPKEFVIQLYNPDQQVVIRHRPATWNSAAAWEFDLPQQSFRTPSTSALDRSQHDPLASELTPRIGLKWKKDSKLSKDLACFLSGKSLNPDGTKKKHKEPDITVAIFKGLKEVTLYEPNLVRVDIEDIKGLEVVLLLGAIIIRDVYFGSMKETFNLTDGRKASASNAVPGPTSAGAQVAPLSTSPTAIASTPVRNDRVPPTDPRSQWEIDAETARLKRQAEAEEKQRRQQELEQERQVRKMLEAEEREARRRKAEVEKETERLKKIYGVQPLPERPHSHPSRRHSTNPQPSHPQQTPNAWGGFGPGSYNAGPYMSGAQAAASQSTLLSPDPRQQRLKNKTSIFGFRRHAETDDNRLSKKRSAVF